MENSELKIDEIDQVMTLLQQLNIPATYDNMSILMLCLQLLTRIKQKQANAGAVEEDQNADRTDGQ